MSPAATTEPADRPDVVAEVEARARGLYADALGPIGARFDFDAPPPPAETRGPPMVLLLGNHSSGKSSFINWVVGEEVQRTGIAPIDDGFTIITRGPERDAKDGAAVVTNPDLPWGDLERFGPTLVSHLRLRLVPSEALAQVALVDSPGMIDAADQRVDRGYDFAGVVRWFAERADVILLLFDPDKPGTTGETLSVLTQSLSGLEHKLLIIFNKVDRFGSMRDYARAYGALCWNLSKAIPRKDLPHIYNTYLPTEEAAGSGIPLDDFDKQRDEVRAEVMRAPQRKVDNVVSRLHQHAKRLRVHATVIDRLARERRAMALRYVGLALAALLVGWLALQVAGLFVGKDGQTRLLLWDLALVATALAAVGGMYAWERRAHARELSLDALFERAYARELVLGDGAEDLRALWASVRERVRRALDARGGAPVRLRRSEARRLDRLIGEEIKALRSRAGQGPPA